MCRFGIDIDGATKNKLTDASAKRADRALNIRRDKTDHVDDSIEISRFRHLYFKSGVVLPIASNSFISFRDIRLRLSAIVER